MSKLADSVTGARLLGQRMLQSGRMENPEGRMSLIEHIRELRSRLVKAVLGIIVVMGVVLIPALYDRIWAVIERPFCKATINGMSGCHKVGDQLVVSGVIDPFTLRIQVAFIVALVVSSPIWLYQVWAFIAPGLYARERRWTYAFVGAAVPLFLAGAAAAYFAMSRGLRFLLGLTTTGVLNLPTVSSYLGYVEAMVLGFGLTLELPLILVLLNRVRILTHERFRKWRRMMIFLVFVFAGMATPSPDPLTMLLLAAPCVVLVEVAEVIIWRYDRKLAARPSLYEGLADDEPAPLEPALLDGTGPDDDPIIRAGDAEAGR
jgi:sec-independent protein translocase protein TatC